ncbi:MAG: hypothetical protein COA32_17510 [Fluviicola sp.]|nr:MAG: hypothetical protein COA32_17510 [Fluviicola sp.]
MNTLDRIHYIKKNRKSPLSFDDYFCYTLAVILSCLIIYLCDGIALGISLHDYSTRTKLTFLIPLLLLFGLVVILVLGARRNRRFEELELKTTFESSKDIIISAAQKILNVSNISINDELGLIIIYTKMSALSWGEKVTVINTDKGVLINSRPDSSQLVTLYHDSRNIKRLSKEINKTKCN